MRRSRAELHSLAGPYALDAVSPRDRVSFERHLAACDACAAEVDELRQVTAGLAAATSSPVPAGLIARVLESAVRTQQLSPAVSQRRVSRRWPIPAPPGFASLAKVTVALAMVLVTVTAGTGLVAVRAEHQLTDTQVRDHLIAEVLNAPDAIMKTVRVRSAGKVTVVVSRTERVLVFTTEGLPSLPAGHCYQLWLVGRSGERSANMLPPPRNGMTSPVVAVGLSPGDWASLTVEPDGGSQHPTSAPILMLSLTG
jgi:anti-sigma-K factor RskA